MGLFDRFLGGKPTQPVQPQGWGRHAASGDDQAVERYRYLLRTASPETLEQTHAEAFAKLTPDQRQRVLQELSTELPEAERATVLRAGESPATLARAATRAELRQPGTLERTFGRVGGGAGGIGLGGMMAGTLLSTMAGAVLGTALANTFFDNASSDAGTPQEADAGGDAGGYSDAGDAGGFDGDAGGFDSGGMDV
jgi:hypothetical protein